MRILDGTSCLQNPLDSGLGSDTLELATVIKLEGSEQMPEISSATFAWSASLVPVRNGPYIWADRTKIKNEA